MATEERNFRTSSIFWSEEGITAKGNKRPKKKNAAKNNLNKSNSTEESNISGKPKNPMIHTAKPKEIIEDEESILQKRKQRENASLKDLCVEDKKRVANLIKELARLGEEKETVAELLTNERELFEEQIQDLVSQQEKIITEREAIEQQLSDCQDLIVKYQQVIAEHKSGKSSNSSVSESDKKMQPVINRPFTSMIDKLINEEKLDATDDRELKLGPLINPKFESTQTSEMDLKNGEFLPLHSDTTVTSAYIPDQHLFKDTDQNKNLIENQPTVNLNDNLPVEDLNDRDAPIPEYLDDAEFLKCYRELKPEQRKKQLFIQKQSLLQEQERLKTILNEQEKLLAIKQDKLRQQQDMQKNRLLYFEKNGHFPQHYLYKQAAHQNNSYQSDIPPTNEYDHRYLYNYSGHSELPSSHLQWNHHSGKDMEMPSYGEQFPYENFTGQFNPQHPPQPKPPLSYPYPTGCGSTSYEGYNTAVVHDLPLPATHGKITLPSYQPDTDNASKLVFTHPVFSGIQERLPESSEQHRIRTSPPTQNLRDHQHVKAVPKNIHKGHQKKTLGSESVGMLLDLVDEVDSLYEETRSNDPLKPYLTPSRKEADNDSPVPVDLFQHIDDIRGEFPVKEGRYHRKDSYANDSTIKSQESLGSDQDELDESHVLEDVFFIR